MDKLKAISTNSMYKIIAFVAIVVVAIWVWELFQPEPAGVINMDGVYKEQIDSLENVNEKIRDQRDSIVVVKMLLSIKIDSLNKLYVQQKKIIDYLTKKHEAVLLDIDDNTVSEDIELLANRLSKAD